MCFGWCTVLKIYEKLGVGRNRFTWRSIHTLDKFNFKILRKFYFNYNESKKYAN